jgi:hypothetical protein
MSLHYLRLQSHQLRHLREGSETHHCPLHDCKASVPACAHDLPHLSALYDGPVSNIRSACSV